MTDTTQPPAETLGMRDDIARIINGGHGDPKHSVPSAAGRQWALAQKTADAVLSALTRRAGGDATPAGVSAVMGRILGHYGEDPGTLARIKGMVAQYREAPFRSAEWLAGEIMRILDSEPANDTTPKPPAGGDAIPAGMKPWHGGDNAPDDFDYDDVQFSDGIIGLVSKASDLWSRTPASGRPHIIAYTPKPPAGGDAGAVATIADLQRRRASDLDAVINLSLCLKEARDALEWYRDTVGRCRMMHAEGDEARNALHKDCGERAEKALAFRVPARETKHDQ